MAFDFNPLRKLINRAPTSAAPQRAEVEAALASSSAEIARADSAIERLALVRENVLVNGTDADLEKHDALASAELRARDRAEALSKQLAGRLAEIDAAERQKEIERARAEVEKQRDAAVAETKKYLDFALGIRGIASTLAKSRAAALDFAAKYPDQPPIADAETIARGDPGLPKKILSESNVELWADRNGCPVAPAYQGKVKRSDDNPKKGLLPISRTYSEEVERRPFRQVEFLPATGSWTPPLLEASVILPGFFGADPTIYAPNMRTELLTPAPEQKPAVAPTVSRSPELEFFPIASIPETPADDGRQFDDAGASINAA